MGHVEGRTVIVTGASSNIGEATAAPTDVTDEVQVLRLFEAEIARFGRVDILINNAGIADHTPSDELSLERCRAVIDTNLTSAFPRSLSG